MRAPYFAIAMLLCGCGSSLMDEPVRPGAASADAQLEDPPPPKGALWREDVIATVDRGLGYFLQYVEVEPSAPGGRFEGFRIVSLYPPDMWRRVELQPGDVVTRVNGMPIERDTQAYEAFQSLKSADALSVTYLRAGQQRQLVYRIVSRDGAGATNAKGAEPEPAKAGEQPGDAKPGDAKPAAAPQPKPQKPSEKK